MSDEYYRKQAARRGRLYLISVIAILGLGCVVFGVYRAYLDSCTRSFDRSYESVIQSYIQAVELGEESVVANCWHHDPFFAKDSGCSEACLSKVYRNQFEISNINFGEAYLTPEGRLNMDVGVTVVCADGTQEYSGEVVLDTIAQNYPWKHWHITYSTLGGTIVDPWCE